MCVYIYIYIYTYVCTCICICICMCVYIYIYVYIYVCMYVYMYIYIYICMYVCMYGSSSEIRAPHFCKFECVGPDCRAGRDAATNLSLLNSRRKERSLKPEDKQTKRTNGVILPFCSSTLQ